MLPGRWFSSSFISGGGRPPSVMGPFREILSCATEIVCIVSAIHVNSALVLLAERREQHQLAFGGRYDEIATVRKFSIFGRASCRLLLLPVLAEF